MIGRTEDEVAQKYHDFISLVSIEDALRMLGRPFNGHDFTTYKLDEAFPDVAHIGVNSQQSAVLKITKAAAAEGLTLRQVALRFATPRNVFTGTPVQVADALQTWFEERASDGFVTFESLPGQLELFVETVVPILQDRGIFRMITKARPCARISACNFPKNRYNHGKTPKHRGRVKTGQGPRSFPAALPNIIGYHCAE